MHHLMESCVPQDVKRQMKQNNQEKREMSEREAEIKSFPAGQMIAQSIPTNQYWTWSG